MKIARCDVPDNSLGPCHVVIRVTPAHAKLIAESCGVGIAALAQKRADADDFALITQFAETLEKVAS